MRVIHEWTMTQPITRVPTHEGYTILAGGVQPEDAGGWYVTEPRILPVVWAEVDMDAPTTEVDLLTVSTGHPVPPGGEYVTTVAAGSMVLHLYARPVP